MADDEDDIEPNESDQRKLFDERVESEGAFNPNDTIPSNHFSAVQDRILEIENKLEKLQASKSTETLDKQCSFCGKDKRKVKQLLQAETGVAICNECVLACMNELNKPDDE